MDKGRVEAFTDAIVAIVMTIMVLEIKVPEGTSLAVLLEEWPYFVAFVVSFLTIATSWYMHHYIFARAAWISKRAFWANILWLLLMAVFPVTTGWVSEHLSARVPEYTYFLVWVAWSASYYLLDYVITCDNRDRGVRPTAAASPIRHEPIDISLLAAGLVLTYFFPPFGLIITFVHSISWAILTPADSDRVGSGSPE